MNEQDHHRQYSDHEVEQLLIKHGVKPTPQRAVIAKYLLSTDSHPTADEVFQAVTGNLPVPLSRATVYNTLNALVEAGVILEVVIEPGKSRYDAKVAHHHHFVDVESGQVLDVEPDEVASLPLALKESFLAGKFAVDDYRITFFGRRK